MCVDSRSRMCAAWLQVGCTQGGRRTVSLWRNDATGIHVHNCNSRCTMFQVCVRACCPSWVAAGQAVTGKRARDVFPKVVCSICSTRRDFCRMIQHLLGSLFEGGLHQMVAHGLCVKEGTPNCLLRRSRERTTVSQALVQPCGYK